MAPQEILPAIRAGAVKSLIGVSLPLRYLLPAKMSLQERYPAGQPIGNADQPRYLAGYAPPPRPSCLKRRRQSPPRPALGAITMRAASCDHIVPPAGVVNIE